MYCRPRFTTAKQASRLGSFQRMCEEVALSDVAPQLEQPLALAQSLDSLSDNSKTQTPSKSQDGFDDLPALFGFEPAHE